MDNAVWPDLIATTARQVVAEFWKMGMLPNKRTIRLVQIDQSDKYQITAMGVEIPPELLEDETLDSLQAIFDRTPSVFEFPGGYCG